MIKNNVVPIKSNTKPDEAEPYLQIIRNVCSEYGINADEFEGKDEGRTHVWLLTTSGLGIYLGCGTDKNGLLEYAFNFLLCRVEQPTTELFRFLLERNFQFKHLASMQITDFKEIGGKDAIVYGSWANPHQLTCDGFAVLLRTMLETAQGLQDELIEQFPDLLKPYDYDDNSEKERTG